MVPLLAAVFDFNSTPATYESYDRMSARELFQRQGPAFCCLACCEGDTASCGKHDMQQGPRSNGPLLQFSFLSLGILEPEPGLVVQVWCELSAVRAVPQAAPPGVAPHMLVWQQMHALPSRPQQGGRPPCWGPRLLQIQVWSCRSACLPRQRS